MIIDAEWIRVAARSLPLLVTLSLLNAAGVTIAPAGSHAKAETSVVSEWTYGEIIAAAGIDEECFLRGAEFAGCLKWILLDTEEIRWVSKGEVSSQVPNGHLSPGSISPSGNYLCLFEKVEERTATRYRHMVYDWDGKKLWEMEHPWGTLHLRNDGSSVLPRMVHLNPGESYALGAEFFDKQGNLMNNFGLPKLECPIGWMYDVNDGFFGIVTYGSGYDLHARVFDKAGQLVWQRDALLGENYKSIAGGVAVTVSDHGELLLCVRAAGDGRRVLVFGPDGERQDSVALGNTGHLGALEAYGRLAFCSTRRGPEPGVFFCYDLDSMRCRFRIEADEGEGFGRCFVNLEENLVAVAAHDETAQDKLVKIYDLQGNYMTEIDVDRESWRRSLFWFGLVGGNVLLAQNHQLKLVETRGR